MANLLLHAYQCMKNMYIFLLLPFFRFVCLLYRNKGYFYLKMHQNAFGGRNPPGPAGKEVEV